VIEQTRDQSAREPALQMAVAELQNRGMVGSGVREVRASGGDTRATTATGLSGLGAKRNRQ
jgi:hypothetical protein